MDIEDYLVMYNIIELSHTYLPPHVYKPPDSYTLSIHTVRVRCHVWALTCTTWEGPLNPPHLSISLFFCFVYQYPSGPRVPHPGDTSRCIILSCFAYHMRHFSLIEDLNER